MKKRIAAFLLALFLAIPTAAQAAGPSTEHFTRAKSYAGQFSDLDPVSPFYDNVSALYEYGLSVGKADGTYGLKDPLTVGQAVIFAGRIRSLYCTGDPEQGPQAYRAEDLIAATPYLLYLQAEGVLDTALDHQLTSTATRAQMAHVLANVLPEEALPSVHHDLVTQCYATRRFISDVTEYTPYFQDILSLYRRGVCIGADASGSYLPDQPITRGAAAAMLTRMVDPTLRMTPQWSLLYAVPPVRGTTMAALVEPGTYYASPATPEEWDETIRYMLASDSHTLTLTYPDISVVKSREVMATALATVKNYCEQSYNSASCTLRSPDSVTITFSAAGDSGNLAKYRAATMESAIAVHDHLWSSGYLREDMTEQEKARVYYLWICENCAYDQHAGDDSLSHIAYNLFERGLAVCDGYTGAYNLLLKLEGIDCGVEYTDSHIWTVATLDGTEYHIDTTWGDTEKGALAQYFGMTPEQSVLYHK